jgi:hypothetical protein
LSRFEKVRAKKRNKTKKFENQKETKKKITGFEKRNGKNGKILKNQGPRNETKRKNLRIKNKRKK